jgi:hypothetical protein
MVLVKLLVGLMARADMWLQNTDIVRAPPHSSEQVSAHLDPQAGGLGEAHQAGSCGASSERTSCPQHWCRPPPPYSGPPYHAQ